MKKYLQWLEQTETYRGRSIDRHIVDRFLEDYTIVYDSDDHIPDPDAIAEFALAASKGEYDLIYCDEDIIRKRERCAPFFKPDYSPDTDMATGYIDGMKAVRKKASTLEPFYFEREKVCHIDKVLYHRVKEKRISPRKDVRSGAEDAGQFTISVIILSKDHPDMFSRCIDTVKRSLGDQEAQLILMDNGSREENRKRYEEICRASGTEYYYDPMEFNYSALNNKGADHATGDVLVFMNDDIEIPATEREVLTRMAKRALSPHTGAVGIKLLYPDGERIQHCGVVLLKSGPSHKLLGYEDRDHYHGYSTCDINTLAVTGACLAIQKSRFDLMRGFDENLKVAYNDVDLCMRLYEEGFYNVCMNSESLIHYESVTRPDDSRDAASYERLKKEREYFGRRHELLIGKGDPFINRSLADYTPDFRIDLPEEWELSGIADPRPMDKKTKIRKRKKIYQSMDRFDYRLSDAYGNEDFYEISGWIFKKGKRRKRTGVVLQSGGDRYLAEASEVKRQDVADVFKSMKGSNDSGFLVRISAKRMKDAERDGEITAYPVLIGKRGRLYRGIEECQKKRRI